MSAPDYDFRDPIFKGCTRPAMMFGVPIVPLAITSTAVVLLSIWISVFLVLLLVPLIITMRQITKSDDQQFRLLGLKLFFRGINRNANGKFWKSSAYSPLAFKKRK